MTDRYEIGIRKLATAASEAVPAGALLAPASAYQRWWLQDQFAGWNNNNVLLAWRIQGRLDRGVLAAAIDGLFHRHEALRTRLVYERGELHQCVLPFRSPPIAETDLRFAHSPDESLAEALAGAFDAPFDLLAGALARVHLFVIGDADIVVALAMSHAISDLASCTQLDTDFRAHLTATGVGTAANENGLSDRDGPKQYRHFAAWERGLDRELAAGFWRARLRPSEVVLPVVEEADPGGKILGCAPPGRLLDPARVRRLGDLATRGRATFPAAVFAGVAAALAPWAPEALRLGVVHHHRSGSPFASVVGPLSGVLPLRVPTATTSTFAELVAQTGREWLACLLHRVPLGVVFELACAPGWFDSAIADISVNFIGATLGQPTMPRQEGRLRITPHPISVSHRRMRTLGWDVGAFPYALTLQLDRAGALHVNSFFDPHSMPAQTVRSLEDHLRRVFTRVVDAPDEKLAPTRLSGAENKWRMGLPWRYASGPL